MASKGGDNGRRKREIAAVAHRAALQGQLPPEEIDRTMRQLGRAGRRILGAIVRMLSGPSTKDEPKREKRSEGWLAWRQRWRTGGSLRVGRARPGGTRAHPTARAINHQHFVAAQERAEKRGA